MAWLCWAGSWALRSIWADAEKQEKKTETEDDVVPDVSGTERLDLTQSLEYSHCHQSYQFKGFNKELQRLCSAGRVTGPGFRPGTSETNQFWVTSTRYRTGIIRVCFILVILYMFLEEMTWNFKARLSQQSRALPGRDTNSITSPIFLFWTEISLSNIVHVTFRAHVVKSVWEIVS